MESVRMDNSFGKFLQSERKGTLNRIRVVRDVLFVFHLKEENILKGLWERSRRMEEMNDTGERWRIEEAILE